MHAVLGDLPVTLTGAAMKVGWTPADLGQLVRRRLTPRHVEVITAWVTTATDSHPPDSVAPEWFEELAGLGVPNDVDLRSVAGLAMAIDIAAVLRPPMPTIARVMAPPGAARRGATRAGPRHPKDLQRLAKVRALLAKAESTEFAEEAEVLSAKAQELITRYALERLLDAPELIDGASVPEGVLLRRIWIDPPYVSAKGLLIQYVAHANRCRAIMSPEIGFSSVMGVATDLEAVELMITSLLVQAGAAMLRHGSQMSRYGTSLTASFRRSFLVAYSQRIGERLQEVTDQATAATGRAGELVPVLADRAARIDAAQDEHFPRVTKRGTRISNEHGWVAGRAAADLARLDIRPAVEDG